MASIFNPSIYSRIEADMYATRSDGREAALAITMQPIADMYCGTTVAEEGPLCP
jgi:hypothetical protein